MSETLKILADKVSIANATGNERIFLAAVTELLATVRSLPTAEHASPSDELAAMEAQKDAAYLERNRVVAALAKSFPSGVARTAIESWSAAWHGCVYIDLPTGQASWHFHDSQAHLFDGLPPYKGIWDGHTTERKYERLAALPSSANAEEILTLGDIALEECLQLGYTVVEDCLRPPDSPEWSALAATRLTSKFAGASQLPTEVDVQLATSQASTNAGDAPIRARKVGGSYEADGTIVSRFLTRRGKRRVVFEFDNPAGMLHIFAPEQVEMLASPPQLSVEDFPLPEQLARWFHETYERLAPQFGYQTRVDTKQFDPASNNGRLMLAVCSKMRAWVASSTGGASCAPSALTDGAIWSNDALMAINAELALPMERLGRVIRAIAAALGKIAGEKP